MKMKPISLVIALLAVLALAGFLVWQRQKSAVPPIQEPPKSLGGQIFEQTANPIKEKLPETNPFTKTDTNPLNAVYKNPF